MPSASLTKLFIIKVVGDVYMTETNQILSKIANTVETDTDNQNYEVADDKEVEAISKKLIEQNLEAYKKLAE